MLVQLLVRHRPLRRNGLRLVQHRIGEAILVQGLLGLVHGVEHLLFDVFVLVADQLGVPEVPLNLEDDLQALVELEPVAVAVVDAAVAAGHVQVVSGPHVDDVVFGVGRVDLVALPVLYEVNGASITTSTTEDHLLQVMQYLPFLELVLDDLVNGAQGSVADEGLHSIGKLFDQVGCCYSADRTTVHSNLTTDLQSVGQELQNALSIYPLLIHIDIRGEDALLRASVTTIIPGKDIAISSQEEVEPVSIS